jgi:hypothetical protein
MTPAFTDLPSPAYRHLGGDIFYGSEWVSDADARAKADLALRDHDACMRQGDRLGARVARKVFLDLTDAFDAQARWLRCARVDRLSGRDLDAALRAMPTNVLIDLLTPENERAA